MFTTAGETFSTTRTISLRRLDRGAAAAVEAESTSQAVIQRAFTIGRTIPRSSPIPTAANRKGEEAGATSPPSPVGPRSGPLGTRVLLRLDVDGVGLLFAAGGDPDRP